MTQHSVLNKKKMLNGNGFCMQSLASSYLNELLETLNQYFTVTNSHSGH